MTAKSGIAPIRYVTCDSVDHKTLLGVFSKDIGWDFESVAHFSVTQELTFELQTVGIRRALPLGAIIDALEFSLVRGHSLSPERFPGRPEEPHPNPKKVWAFPFPGWLNTLMEWYDELNSRKLDLNIMIREVIHESLQQMSEGSSELRSVFDSGGAIAKAIRQLIEVGLRPENLNPRSLEGGIAKNVWCKVAERIPDSHVLLDYLFIDHDDPSKVRDSQRARKNLEDLLRKAFGFEAEEKIKIAYHGLYFYSPLQWAIFDLISRMGIEQVFIVHDDGVGPQFEIWRRFFFESQHLISLATTTLSERQVDPRAEFFSAVLAGVRPTLPANLNIFPFRSVTDLARHVRQSDTDKGSEGRVQRQVFAAAASDLNRRIGRLGRISGERDDRKLLHLPIGRFLLGLQECVRVTADGVVSGLDYETMSHLVEGGYLNSSAGDISDRPLTEVLSLCEVFFSGCRSLDDWASRLTDLEAFYLPQSHGFAGIIKHNSDERFPLRDLRKSDSDYLVNAAKNHLRRAPWLDLSKSEWRVLSESIRNIVNAIKDLTQAADVETRERIDELVNLVRTSAVAPELYGDAEWERVMGVLNRLPTAPNIRVQISRISEILPMILGRQLDYGQTEIEGSKIEAGLVYSQSAPLRGLEACGFARKPKVHLANLSDTVFPYKPKLFSWPFRRDEIAVANGDEALAWRIRIVDELDRSGGLGDLYLLWLALDGSDGEVMLSWLSEAAGEKLNPSPLLALLLEVEKARPVVRAFAGGVVVNEGLKTSRSGTPKTKISIVTDKMPTEGEVNDYFDQIKSTDGHPASMALASAEICPRRTALHWLLKPSAAYRPMWQLGILYGNLLGLPQSEVRKGRVTGWENEWKRILDRLWSWMTDAERERTAARSSINRRPDDRSAYAEWLLTLEGAHDRQDRLSDAYRSAMKPGQVRAKVGKRLFSEQNSIVPKPNLDGLEADDLFGDTQNQMWYLCDRCPVSDRCLERRYRPE